MAKPPRISPNPIEPTIQQLQERIERLESILHYLQTRHMVPYIGICENASLEPELNHPHWDSDFQYCIKQPIL